MYTTTLKRNKRFCFIFQVLNDYRSLLTEHLVSNNVVCCNTAMHQSENDELPNYRKDATIFGLKNNQKHLHHGTASETLGFIIKQLNVPCETLLIEDKFNSMLMVNGQALWKKYITLV